MFLQRFFCVRDKYFLVYNCLNRCFIRKENRKIACPYIDMCILVMNADFILFPLGWIWGTLRDVMPTLFLQCLFRIYPICKLWSYYFVTAVPGHLISPQVFKFYSLTCMPLLCETKLFYLKKNKISNVSREC